MPIKTLTLAKDKTAQKPEAVTQVVRKSASIPLQGTSAISMQLAQREPWALMPEDVAQLQRSVGNRAVGRLLQTSMSCAASAGVPQSPQQRPSTSSLGLSFPRQGGLEEDRAMQMKHHPTKAKCQDMENPEIRQRKFEPAQREGDEEEEVVQRQFNTSIASTQAKSASVPNENRTGMPGQLKVGLETLSGIDLSNVRVHHNSSKPAKVNALAYTQGLDIYVGPGQEQYLPHEGWHAVQQLQGRVKTTIQAKGVAINADEQLEREADVMGPEALQTTGVEQTTAATAGSLRMRSAPTHIAAVSGDPFDRQPAALRNLIKPPSEDPEGWASVLHPEEKMALTMIFNRLAKYGLLPHVLFVMNIFNGETPAKLWDLRFNVAGSTPSVYFRTPSWHALFHALMATGNFCIAYGTGNSYHPEQMALREISRSDSLHISIGPGDQFDAHIDKFSPVPNHPGSSFCPNTPSPAAIGHFGREAFPETVRKQMKGLREKVDFVPVLPHLMNLPGMELFPETNFLPMPHGLPGSESPPILISLTFRGPVERRQRQKSAVASLPDNIVDHLVAKIPKRIPNDALVPSGAKRQFEEAILAAKNAGRGLEGEFGAAREEAREHLDGFPQAHEFALDLAKKMAQASRSNSQAFVVQLGPLYEKLTSADGQHVLKQIKIISRIVRGLLAERAGGVNKVWVAFGENVMRDIDF